MGFSLTKPLSKIHKMAAFNKSVVRNSVLKVKSLDPRVESWYKDIQDDYRRFFNLFFDLAGLPHGVLNDDDSISYVHREDAELKKKVTCNHPSVDEFIKALMGEPEGASSCYGVFSEKYKPSSKAKFSKAKSNFLISINDLEDDKLENKIEKLPGLEKYSLEQWRSIGERISNGEDPKVIWDEISKDVKNDKSYIVDLRQNLPFECHRPTDVGYCKSLMEMIRRSIKSFKEKSESHIAELNDLKESLESQRTPLFEKVLKFSNELDDVGYGISKYVLFKSIKDVKNGTTTESYVQPAVDILKGDKYNDIINASEQEIKQAFRLIELHKKITKRKIYPTKPTLKSDYKIPSGSDRGRKFNITKKRNSLTVTLVGLGDIECIYTNYLHGFQCEPIKGGFKITYCTKNKGKGKSKIDKYGKVLSGSLKEIGISRKDDYYTISFPITIDEDSEKRRRGIIWQTADPKKESLASIPDKIEVAAFDLNISNPVCGVRAIIGRDMDGPLTALGYGKGVISVQPQIVAGNGPHYSKLAEIRLNCQKTIKAIREDNIRRNRGTEICESTMEFLNSIRSPEGDPRIKIQSWVGKLNRELKKYKKILHKKGYSDLGEAIKLLDAMDKVQQMNNSFSRTYPYPGAPLQKKFDTSRANFRLFLTRRIAAKIAEFSQGCDVVFIEDLESIQKSGNKNNSLVRLFSSGTLKQCITLALEKYGIPVVEVDKNGTSKTDPITGALCGRDTRYNKQKSFVERDGIIGWIDSDVAASVNVLIRGLNRSVCPYRHYIPSKSQKDKSIGKRATKFFKTRYGTANIKFAENSEGTVDAYKSSDFPKDAVELESCHIYFHNPEKILTRTRHREEEERLKQLGMANKDAPQFDVNPVCGQSYDNFRVV